MNSINGKKMALKSSFLFPIECPIHRHREGLNYNINMDVDRH